MKCLFKNTIAAFILFACFNLRAQVDTNQIYTTVKDAFITLTAKVQTSNDETHTVRITNKDILAALNATGVFNFTNDAKLLMQSVEAGLPFFVVRESISNEVTTINISDYLTVTEPDDAVHGHNSITNWGIWNIVLNGGDGNDFTIWGFTTLHTGSIPTGNGGNLLRTVNLMSVGSGAGHVEGANAQFAGKVIADHGRLD
jgi:hypothetical protein